MTDVPDQSLPSWAVDRTPDGRPSACFWHEVPDFEQAPQDETPTRPNASGGGSEPDDTSPQTDLTKCYGCKAMPGEHHEDNCDWACCPDCGEQLIFHRCDDPSGLNPERPAIWHGLPPYVEVARALDWWTTAAGIDHLVEDATRVLVAAARGEIRWNPETQRYDVP